MISTLADYYCQHRQLKKALPLFKKIVEQHPDDHKALRHMAEIYLESKDYETAEFLTKQALSLSSQNPKYAVTLTEIYYNTGRMGRCYRYYGRGSQTKTFAYRILGSIG